MKRQSESIKKASWSTIAVFSFLSLGVSKKRFICHMVNSIIFSFLRNQEYSSVILALTVLAIYLLNSLKVKMPFAYKKPPMSKFYGISLLSMLCAYWSSRIIYQFLKQSKLTTRTQEFVFMAIYHITDILFCNFFFSSLGGVKVHENITSFLIRVITSEFMLKPVINKFFSSKLLSNQTTSIKNKRVEVRA